MSGSQNFEHPKPQRTISSEANVGGTGADPMKGVHFVRRNGNPPKWYMYAWRGGPCIRKVEGVDKPTLNRADLAAISEARKPAPAPAKRNLGLLITEWENSPEWRDMADTTKRTWRCALSTIDKKWGEVPLSIIDNPKMVGAIIRWRDSRSETPRGADIGVAVLRRLLEFGRLRAYLTTNSAAGIPTIYEGGDRAEIVWTSAELDLFVQKASELQMPAVGDAVQFAGATGLRRADLCTVTFSHLRETAIVKKALKRSRRKKRRFAVIPRLPSLDGLLVQLNQRHREEGVDTILVDDRGRAWTPDRLTKAVAEVRDAVGIVHVDEETGLERKKHLHDLRGTFATRLMTETDLSDEEIADIMAWSPEEVSRIRKVYVDQGAKAMAVGARIRRFRGGSEL